MSNNYVKIFYVKIFYVKIFYVKIFFVKIFYKIDLNYILNLFKI